MQPRSYYNGTESDCEDKDLFFKLYQNILFKLDDSPLPQIAIYVINKFRKAVIDEGSELWNAPIRLERRILLYS